MLFRPGIVVALLTLFVAPVWGETEEEAVTVFQRVSPSVVALESVASSGTGFLLDSKGTILTNAHVVAMPLPMKCLVDVKVGAKTETVTYRKVTVMGVHPTLDLAIVKIDPTEHNSPLKPALIGKTTPLTGQRVYAIGNPGTSGRVKLTKTVTSGLLSGVDRVIDDVSYLQIDAAINPGNSGGPLCDRSGKVIGLVTMKLKDLDNVGFAIPMQGLEMSQFKPLKERVGDPVKAGKLIEVANKFIHDINTLSARRLGDSQQAIALKALTLEVYHRALLLDPNNGSLYASIGDLLDTFEEYEIAEEYYRAGLTVSPWSNDPRIYRAYGMHKMRQKQPADAVAIWWEGVAKHPDRSGQIFDDLAILYRDQQNYVNAVACARAMTLMLSSGARLPTAQTIWQTSLAKTTDPVQLAQINDYVEGMPAEIDRRIKHRNLALEQKRGILTPAFAAFAKKNGIFLDGEITTGAKLVSTPKYDARLIDLVGSADLSRPATGSAWLKTGNILLSPAKTPGRLPTKCVIPDEYDLTLEAERLDGASELAIGFTWQGQPAVVVVDFAGQKTGFAGLPKPLHAKPILPKGELVSLFIQVRKGRVTVRADEWDLLTLEGSDKPPPVPERWKAGANGELFVSTQDSSIAIYHWSLAKYSPTTITPPPTSAGAAVAASRPAVPLRPTPGPVTQARGNPFKPSTAGSSPATVSSSGSAAILPKPGPTQLLGGPGGIEFRPLVDFPDMGWGVQCLAFSPDGRYVAAGKMDNQVWIFDLVKNQRVAESGRLEDVSSVTAIRFTPDGAYLLAGGRKGLIQIWKFQDGKLTADRQFAGHSAEVQVLEISADGKFVLSGGRDDRLRYWGLATCREQFVFGGFSRSPKGALLLAGGKEAIVTEGLSLLKLDLSSGSSTKIADGLNCPTGVAAFSPDGQTVALSDTYKIRFFRTRDGRELGPLDTKQSIWTLLYTPDSKHILSGVNGKVDCWDADEADPVGQVPMEPNQYVKAVVVSPDGKRLASIGTNAGTTLHVFEIVPPK